MKLGVREVQAILRRRPPRAQQRQKLMEGWSASALLLSWAQVTEEAGGWVVEHIPCTGPLAGV